MKIPDLSSYSRTLFLPAPGTHGILVTRTRGRYRDKSMQFANASAALSWCESHNAALVYWPAPKVERN